MERFEFNGHDYGCVFDINVMMALQSEYGSYTGWVKLLNQNILEEETDEEEKEEEKAEKEEKAEEEEETEEEKKDKPFELSFEPTIKALYYAINESVEIDREEGIKIEPLSEKQVGRMMTKYGFWKMRSWLTEAMFKASPKNTSKNE